VLVIETCCSDRSWHPFEKNREKEWRQEEDEEEGGDDGGRSMREAKRVNEEEDGLQEPLYSERFIVIPHPELRNIWILKHRKKKKKRQKKKNDAAYRWPEFFDEFLKAEVGLLQLVACARACVAVRT
jgi:hypothetical protein